MTKKNLKQVMEDLISKDGLIRYFKQIKKILKEYMDMDEEHYSLVSLWIVGTYFHKQFPTYPYLFFNAMRGSGKTRILKIISNLAKNGSLIGSITEAVLFRTAKENTLCLDEVERVGSKEKQSLKELLNSAYKKGLNVKRTERDEKGNYVIKEFEVYCPISLANISGMENVLSDRCIQVTLEKSDKFQITKLIETFEDDIEFHKTRGGLKRLTENISDSQNIFGNIIQDWNNYIKKINVTEKSQKSENGKRNVTISKGNVTDVTLVTLKGVLYNKINDTNISGRDLELFFPLFIISDMCSKKLFDEILETSRKIIKEKKERDREENKDIQLYEFISNYNDEEFITATKLVNDFRVSLEIQENKESWLNSWWMGRALRRLKLVKDIQRTGRTRRVKVNVEKAKEKLLMFKDINVTNVTNATNVTNVTNVTNNKLLNQFTDEEIKKTGYTKEELEKMTK